MGFLGAKWSFYHGYKGIPCHEDKESCYSCRLSLLESKRSCPFSCAINALNGPLMCHYYAWKANSQAPMSTCNKMRVDEIALDWTCACQAWSKHGRERVSRVVPARGTPCSIKGVP